MLKHRYHHAITIIYTWYSFRDLVAYGRWFIAMNYIVHSIMYSYYAFRALRFNIPRHVNIVITSLQLLQMAIGIFVNVVAALELYSGHKQQCRVTPENIYFSFLLYISFFVLFFIYFKNAYLKKKSTSTTSFRTSATTTSTIITTSSTTTISPSKTTKVQISSQKNSMEKKVSEKNVEKDYRNLKLKKKMK